MKLNEITETGFYCVVDDTERSYVFEILNNTDKNWLKKNPKATLLIDEWIYDYTDYDDRKVYGTGGNLVAICFAISNAQVYKIEDMKYKIYGNSGQYLIEDKPTYKELFQAEQEKVKELEEENKHYKQLAEHHGDMSVRYTNKSAKYRQALEKIQDIVKGFNAGCFYDDFGCSDCDINGCIYNAKMKILQIISEVKNERIN